MRSSPPVYKRLCDTAGGDGAGNTSGGSTNRPSSSGSGSSTTWSTVVPAVVAVIIFVVIVSAIAWISKRMGRARRRRIHASRSSLVSTQQPHLWEVRLASATSAENWERITPLSAYFIPHAVNNTRGSLQVDLTKSQSGGDQQQATTKRRHAREDVHLHIAVTIAMPIPPMEAAMERDRNASVGGQRALCIGTTDVLWHLGDTDSLGQET
ncbi:hypothetical protein AcV7_002532 [Taiwanofungus camphoratus]|nr:hypothetical protein AcV7_002532 [Antrodia cinnamomea]